jgi:ubiquitin-conjugating enzyme E2 variant
MRVGSDKGEADSRALAFAVAALSASPSAAPVRATLPAMTMEDLASTRSTPAQRAVLAGWLLLLLASLCGAGAGAAGAVGAGSAGSAAVGSAAIFAAAWLAADLAVGIFHFAVDNYGEDAHPLVAAFQYHHVKPWTITQGEVATVTEGPCIVTAPLLAASLLTPPPMTLFMAAFAAWCVMAQLAHVWSHERRTALPAPIRLLQDAHILISSKASDSFRVAQ